MEALYSVMVRKQAEIIRVQREIQALREFVRSQQQMENGRCETPKPQQGAARSLAIFLCGLLIGTMLILAVVSREERQAIRWDREEQRIVVFEQWGNSH